MKQERETMLQTMKRKIRAYSQLTDSERTTILTLIDRWYHPAEWVLMSEGYFVCSHCHNEPFLKSYADSRPSPYCPTCGAMMKQPDWLKREENPHDSN